MSMPKKEQKKRISDDNEVIEIEQPITIEQEPPELQELKEQYGGAEYKITVYKITDEGTEIVKRNIPFEQFDMDKIAERFGFGKFKFTIRNEKGEYVKQYVVSYAKPVMPENNPIINTDTTKEKLIETLQQQIEKTEQKTDTFLKEFTSLLKEIVVANANRPQQQQNNIVDDLIKVKQLLGDENKLENLIEFLKLGMSFGKEVSEASTEKSPMDYAMNKLVDLIIPALSQKMSSGQLQSLLQKSNPVVAPVQNPVIEPIVNNTTKIEQINKPEIKMIEYRDDNEKTVIELLKTYANDLLKYSILSIDTIVDYIFNNLSDDILEKLISYLKLDESVDRILTYIPELKQKEDFVRNLRKEIIEAEIVEEKEVSVEDQNKPIDNQEQK